MSKIGCVNYTRFPKSGHIYIQTIVSALFVCNSRQWHSKGWAHWGTYPTNLALCPTKMFLVRFKDSNTNTLLILSKELAIS